MAARRYLAVVAVGLRAWGRVGQRSGRSRTSGAPRGATDNKVPRYPEQPGNGSGTLHADTDVEAVRGHTENSNCINMLTGPSFRWRSIPGIWPCSIWPSTASYAAVISLEVEDVLTWYDRRSRHRPAEKNRTSGPLRIERTGRRSGRRLHSVRPRRVGESLFANRRHTDHPAVQPLTG
jgi:hypothetical protein